MRVSRTSILILLGILVAAWLAFTWYERNWYRGLVPAAIELVRTVAIAEEPGFMEGCAVAVFSLGPSSLAGMEQDWRRVLSAARQARGNTERRHAYSEWKETPCRASGDGLMLADRWIHGLDCAELDADLRRKISNSMQ